MRSNPAGSWNVRQASENRTRLLKQGPAQYHRQSIHEAVKLNMLLATCLKSYSRGKMNWRGKARRRDDLSLLGFFLGSLIKSELILFYLFSETSFLVVQLAVRYAKHMTSQLSGYNSNCDT